MTHASLSTSAPPGGQTFWSRPVLTKVPEVVLLFWVVKIMTTTVGETAADFLAGNLGLGLTTTSLIMTGLLAVALAWQVSLRRYVPSAYWLAVVLVSVVGTLVSDNLVDNLGVSLWTTTGVFSAALAASFLMWWRSEHTLSIHTVLTRRREAFYWLTILCTFALGTSAGDLIAERLALGYLPSALMFGAIIAAVYVAHRLGRLGAVAAFWSAYVLTRPFGASVGDFLTQPSSHGGLGLGTNTVSALFLATIIGAVGWFTLEQRRAPAVSNRSA